MTLNASSRREFLLSSSRLLGGGWIGLRLPALASLASCARTAASSGEPFRVLTEREARTLGAFASQILPSDELPGAEDAGAIHFIDQALATIFSELLEPIRAGAEELDTRARAKGSDAITFADLPGAEQIAIMRELEGAEFFEPARMLTVMGMFALPAHGGTGEAAGRALVRIEPTHVHQPPFGWYDAERVRAEGRLP